MQSLKQAFQSQYFRENRVKPRETSREQQMSHQCSHAYLPHQRGASCRNNRGSLSLPSQTSFPAEPAGTVGGKGKGERGKVWIPSFKEDPAGPNFCQVGMSDSIVLNNGWKKEMQM